MEIRYLTGVTGMLRQRLQMYRLELLSEALTALFSLVPASLG